MKLIPARIDELSPEKRQSIMERSMEDISSIFEDVRAIVEDVKARGNTVALTHYQKHKADIATQDLEVSEAEIKEAYAALDASVVDCLKTAAQNLSLIHI